MPSPATVPRADFAIVGLGNMGGNLVRQALGKKFRIAGYAILDELAGILAAGDIVADGGNSYWGDSMRRGFGGHHFGEDPNVQRERRSGRVGGFPGDGKP